MVAEAFMVAVDSTAVADIAKPDEAGILPLL